MGDRESGTTTFRLRAERRVGYVHAPCGGYYSLVEHESDDSVKRLNAPTMFELVGRALGDYPDIGSEFEVTVTIKVTKRGPPDDGKCNNPWHRNGRRCPR